MALSKIEFDFSYYIDRTAIYLGESSSGKSFIIMDALYQLKPYINQGIVFSPTNEQNKLYDGVFPRPAIFRVPTEELLETIFKRQEARAAVYRKANDPESLKKLFLRIKDPKYSTVIKSLARSKARLLSEVKSDDPNKDDKIKAINDKCISFMTLFYRKGISNHLTKLSKIRDLDEDERFVIEHINFNPRIVLIFDDCTPEVKKLAKTNVMQKLFYQGRHLFITALIAIHTDKALPPEAKKNAFNIIFTAPAAAAAFFRLSSNDFTKQEQIRANAACAEAMSEQYQKLVWIRERKQFYKYKAPKHDKFRFGDDDFWEYCEKVENDPTALDETNEFLENVM
jgi:hypothetical protein